MAIYESAYYSKVEKETSYGQSFIRHNFGRNAVQFASTMCVLQGSSTLSKT